MKSKHLFTPPLIKQQHFFCRVSLFSPVPAVLVRNLVQHQKHNSKQKFLIPPLVRKRIYLQQNKI